MPDKAYLQKIWDGWATLDPAKEDQFHATGPHVFYDESPLKYDSWAEFKSGVTKILDTIKSGTFTVNDDAQLHPAGNYVWGTATVKEDLVMKNGKRDMSTLRWTVVFEKIDGKWLIVHEHISAPAE
jgi:ketosteroid isomerase-like protein